MTATLAAAASPSGTGVLVVIALVVIALWFTASVWWPFGPCRKCRGTGRMRSPTRLYWRACPRCGGNGRRVRTGAQAFRKSE